jgi:replicative DNA helicase
VTEEETRQEEQQESVSVEPSMVECQILNYILSTSSYDLIKKNDLDESYFPGYREEFLFIKKHYTKYNVVPHASTFLDEFNDFDLFEVDESEAALIDKLKEEKGYGMVAQALQEINRRARDDSIEAIKYMKEQGEKLYKSIVFVKNLEVYDLFKRAQERADVYVKKLNMEGILGCISNIEKLDRVTHGWLGNDFVSLTARTEQGKSWILEYLLLMPWALQKKKVLMLSLENSKLLVGYRADTLLEHFSNDALMSGKEVLAWTDRSPSKTTEDYLNYVEQAQHFDIPFIVLDSTDNNDEPFTMPIIEELIELHQPDIIGIDQLSLLAPDKPTRSIRESYVNITRYTRKMVNRIGKPVIMVSQSGRESAKIAMKDKDATPELFHIAESDSIGQDSTRVLSQRILDGILKLSLKKNTMGRSGVDILMKWDIDTGMIEPLALEKDDPNPESVF